MNQTILIALRNALVILYLTVADIRRVVADAGIGVGPIIFEGSTVNIWHSVLAEAAKQHQVEQILTIAQAEYGGNRELQAACRAYRQSTDTKPIPPTQPSHAQPQRRWYLAPTVVLLLVTVTGIMWYQGCLPTEMATPAPPTSTPETAVALGTEATVISPTATAPAPTDTATPTVLPTATLSPTVSTPPTDTPPVPPETDVGLQVLDEGLSANTYLLNGHDVDLFNIGDDLVVYGEPNPGTEIAIALLKVIGKSQNALTAQAILKHPAVEIRTDMRVDGELAHLSESQLIPVFDYVEGYLLRPTRIRLRPGHGLTVGAQLQALEFERIEAEIIDALPTDSIMQIMTIGIDGQIAVVKLLAGEWPIAGTIVSLLAEPTPTPTVPQPTATFTTQPTQTPTSISTPTSIPIPTSTPITESYKYVERVLAYSSSGVSNIKTNPQDILGPPDCGTHSVKNLSLGGGYVVVEMGKYIVDNYGPDIRVYETGPSCQPDTYDEPYEVFASSSAGGPWISLGEGRGIGDFDLMVSGIDKTKYIRIEDRSPDQPNNSSLSPGADINAVEVIN